MRTVLPRRIFRFESDLRGKVRDMYDLGRRDPHRRDRSPQRFRPVSCPNGIPDKGRSLTCFRFLFKKTEHIVGTRLREHHTAGPSRRPSARTRTSSRGVSPSPKRRDAPGGVRGARLLSGSGWNDYKKTGAV